MWKIKLCNWIHGYIQAITYICKNNSWYKIPIRIIWATCIQLIQRITGIIIPITLFNGRQLFLFPRNAVSAMFLYSDIPDKKEISLLRRYANKKSIFLDIGAHIGSYAVCLSDVVGSVYAFEPNPLSAARCKMNFALNSIPEVQVNEMALSDKTGKVRLTDDRENDTGNRITHKKKNSIEIRSTTLDSFARLMRLPRTYSYLIKIDVEGWERHVLQGAVHFLHTHTVPLIVYESFGKDTEWMKKTLEQNGFSVRLLSAHNYSAVRGGQGVAKNVVSL